LRTPVVDSIAAMIAVVVASSDDGAAVDVVVAGHIAVDIDVIVSVTGITTRVAPVADARGVVVRAAGVVINDPRAIVRGSAVNDGNGFATG
jgi:hypothetical protein